MAERTNAEAMDMLIEGLKTRDGFMSVCDMFADDCVMTQDIMFPGKSWNGKAELEDLWREIDEGFDDYRLPVHETVREDDKIVLFGHFEGRVQRQPVRHRGRWQADPLAVPRRLLLRGRGTREDGLGERHAHRRLDDGTSRE